MIVELRQRATLVTDELDKIELPVGCHVNYWCERDRLANQDVHTIVSLRRGKTYRLITRTEPGGRPDYL
jgi:hypothetical protein